MRIGLGANVARVSVDEVITALWTFANIGGLKTDTIRERQTGFGVLIDGALIIDGSHQGHALATAQSIAFLADVAGDVDTRLQINADGKHRWGDGTNPFDTVLYRAAPNLLKTDDAFTVAGQPRCQVYNDADQEVAHLATISVLWNSEGFDVGGMHAMGGISNRITIPADRDGLYVFVAQLDWEQHDIGVRHLEIRYDGTTAIGINTMGGTATTVYNNTQTVIALYDAAAADWFEVRAYQNSGVALDIMWASSWFAAVKLA